MDFQLYSDIHLEFNPDIFPRVPRRASNLILAGDIGHISQKNFKDFIEYCSNLFDHVFYICGNHEFYGSKSMESLIIQFRNYMNGFSNVHFLDNSYIIIDNILIYGFTCWTKSIFQSPASALMSGLADYKRIKTKKGKFTISYQNELANNQIDLFKEFINSVNNNEILCEKVVIVTHFPPIGNGTSNPIYNGNYLNRYFSWSNIFNEESINCDKIKVWCSGHTHWSYDFTKNNIRFIANQIGYSDEGCVFEDKVFTI